MEIEEMNSFVNKEAEEQFWNRMKIRLTTLLIISYLLFRFFGTSTILFVTIIITFIAHNYSFISQLFETPTS